MSSMDWEDQVNDLRIEAERQIEDKFTARFVRDYVYMYSSSELRNMMRDFVIDGIPFEMLKSEKMGSGEFIKAIKIAYALSLIRELSKLDF